ncbi:MAG TPA: PSD1 and planctomycete cytochrome C domain-containing protein [Pirellulales bacterium]|nr:PSD1 and planctomycete cytochrome C domain-containing protein [Pirellulales bacterium]
MVLFGLARPALAERLLDFNRDIRPILSENCFACHGFDEKSREADLRLDQPDSAMADRDGTRAIIPANAAESQVWLRITSTDPDEQMPPPKSNLKLTDEEKAKLRRWIDEGAKYATHWSFVPPVKAELPAVQRSDWPRGPIDRFVLARLETEGLKPSAEADRRMFVRRVTLDLTGLPPSADEVEAFVNDQQEGAYERLVDRLLASPHFGEKLALDWLDAARYADTNGFSIDGGRHQWLWRDWVIAAFNSNMPYDRFLVEQLAGDQVPGANDASLIATGFQRNNMVTHEGGTIPEENLVNYNADRVKTLGEAVLGLTLGCAQCHDHKYDPLTQRDYYRLFAYFNTVSDVGLDGNGGVDPRPYKPLHTVLRTGEERQVASELARLREQLAHPNAKQFAAWEKQQQRELARRGKGMRLLETELLKVSTPNRGNGFEIANGRVNITQAAELAAYDVSMKLPATTRPITGLRVVFYPDAEMPQGGWGYGPAERRPRKGQPKPSEPPPHDVKGNFVLTSISASAEAVPGDQVNLYRLLGIERVTANTWQGAYPPTGCLDPRNDSGWSPDPAFDGPVHLTAMFDEPLSAVDAPYMTVQLNFGHGKSLVAAQFAIFALTGHDDGSPLPADMIAIVQTSPAERTPAQSAALREYFAAHAEATRTIRTAIANLEERLAVQTEAFPTMVMDVAEKPRDTFILNRGDYSQPRDKVTAGTPRALPELHDAANTRLALAEWLTMPGHPLTARVAVNRIWAILFGAGIVRTPADFGAQGEVPTHPELLDWLAVDFVEHGWDVKRLVRMIVLSTTYRQTSVTTPALLEHDPQNRLLARGPRFRLSAELIRDAALATSGLLVPRLGGPGVNPYAPGDLWREISHYGSTPATAQTFVQDHGEKLYRRSLYTYWKRTAPPPNMAAFDAPNREVCTVARPATNTPLQALVLLNDVQFVEASRTFAERIITKASDDTERLRWAFDECLSRLPSDKELSVFTAALARERKRYAANEDAARAYLASGESPRNRSIPVAEHAAWSQLAAMLLNLSETVTRN